MNKITILNYQMGNLLSVAKKVKQNGSEAQFIDTHQEILAAEKIILPGVGHFGKAMENLKKLDLLGALNEAVLDKKIPVLGICLGMQLMAKNSEEGDVDGLGWFDASVTRIKVSDSIKFKIPHTGWNSIEINKPSTLMQNLSKYSEFYFVHAYHMECNDSKDILNTTQYDNSFVSAIEKENIFGVQYHPEKSHQNGNQLIKNFVNL